METDPVFARIEEELARRSEKHLLPGDWYALGRAVSASKQVVGNWKARGKVPRAMHEQIADVFGWSVDQLLGREVSQITGSQDEPDRAGQSTLSLSQISSIYANLADSEKQLFERLLVAAGFKLPGVTVEVSLWERNDKSGSQPRIFSLEPTTARPAKTRRASR